MFSRSSDTTDASSESTSLRAIGISIGNRKGGILLAGGDFLTIAQEVATVTGVNGSTAKVSPSGSPVLAPQRRHNCQFRQMRLSPFPRQRRASAAAELADGNGCAWIADQGGLSPGSRRCAAACWRRLRRGDETQATALRSGCSKSWVRLTVHSRNTSPKRKRGRSAGRPWHTAPSLALRASVLRVRHVKHE